MRYLSALLIALGSLGFAGGAESADISYQRGGADSPNAIFISGRLEPNDELEFANIALTMDRAVVLFASPGGNLRAGIEIGKAIRLKRYLTMVVPDGECASACALAWLGGWKRLAGTTAKIGFHAASDGTTGEATGMGNALVGAYLSQLGLRDDAIAYITYASPREILWLDEQAASSVGIDVKYFDENEFPPAPRDARVELPSGIDFDRKQGVDLFGGDIVHTPFRGISLAACELECANERSCRAYTYNLEKSACFLKSDDYTVMEFEGAVSGIKASDQSALD